MANSEASSSRTIVGDKGTWHSASLDVPFLNSEHAIIAKRALEVDKEQNATFVNRQITTRDNVLHVEFRSTTVRLLRLATNSLFSSIDLVVRTMEEFAPDPSKPPISDEELERIRIEANAGQTKGIELRGDGKGAGSGQEVK